MHKDKFKEDSLHEGRDKASLDIDRMINEGLSGGSVHSRGEQVNIEESRDLKEEEPPFKVDV
ncbi:hypothetical protein ACTHO0_00600 [Cytobacillus praedii]|uniref:Uncharacterized protein n=1 Tax=Cytobacillus praedii TaxID=1742358 RepID=A0A4R1B4E3_9BACI|nr:hypothetical protein [Cytobacillus praedii]MED3551424.1 hypothetical protein [Cytobacillus praedii]MED3572514.1 hypothetical protein [Cytobacillus praedii]TCJ04947.1 hypothetical protein E0Y62_06925 [Cytobacillus praedii]